MSGKRLVCTYLAIILFALVIQPSACQDKPKSGFNHKPLDDFFEGRPIIDVDDLQLAIPPAIEDRHEGFTGTLTYKHEPRFVNMEAMLKRKEELMKRKGENDHAESTKQLAANPANPAYDPEGSMDEGGASSGLTSGPPKSGLTTVHWYLIFFFSMVISLFAYQQVKYGGSKRVARKE